MLGVVMNPHDQNARGDGADRPPDNSRTASAGASRIATTYQTAAALPGPSICADSRFMPRLPSCLYEARNAASAGQMTPKPLTGTPGSNCH